VLISKAELGSLFSTGFCFLAPNSALDPKYLFYFLTSESFQNEKDLLAGEGIMGGIKNSDVASIRIPLPPLPEQHRIVCLLDEVFERIAIAKANAEKNLKNARALFESQLQSVFSKGEEGWVETTLGEAFEVRDGTHDSPRFQPEGYPLVTSKNLKPEGLSLIDVRLISESDYIKINKRSAVHQGDVLFAMIGTIGNPVVVVEKPQFAIKNVALFKNPHGQNSVFLKHYLSSRLVINKMSEEAKGTTQKFVSLGYLRDFPISIPQFSVQSMVVEKLDRLALEMQKLNTNYDLKCSALDALKESFLHQAFFVDGRAA
jgi:type I restriction enzyme S subunit